VTAAGIRFRRATPKDAGPLARGVLDGVADYASFAPPEWSAPSLQAETRHLETVLADEQVYCVLAERGGDLLGQISVMPSEQAAHPTGDPLLAHVSNLFVDRSQWGSGLATALQRAAAEAARERAFTELRLFVAEGQARARRFYEREGWRQRGEAWHDPVPGLAMVEYRYPLTRPPDAA
jgi:GNAT superfamily N-acetyltransferase